MRVSVVNSFGQHDTNRHRESRRPRSRSAAAPRNARHRPRYAAASRALASRSGRCSRLLPVGCMPVGARKSSAAGRACRRVPRSAPSSCGGRTMSRKTSTGLPQLFTVRGVHNQTGLPVSSLYDAIYRGELPAVRLGVGGSGDRRSIRLLADDVAKWIQSRREVAR